MEWAEPGLAGMGLGLQVGYGAEPVSVVVQCETEAGTSVLQHVIEDLQVILQYGNEAGRAILRHGIEALREVAQHGIEAGRVVVQYGAEAEYPERHRVFS